MLLASKSVYRLTGHGSTRTWFKIEWYIPTMTTTNMKRHPNIHPDRAYFYLVLEFSIIIFSYFKFGFNYSSLCMLFIFNALYSVLFYKHFIKHQFNFIWLVSWLFNRHKQNWKKLFDGSIIYQIHHLELFPFWLRVIMLGPISDHRSKFKSVSSQNQKIIKNLPINWTQFSVYLFMRVIIFKCFCIFID